jgi:hypothetical protein
MTPILQQLTWFEYDMAAAVGLRRQVEAMRDQRSNRKQTQTDDLLVHVIGACGELAAAKACGVFWDGSVNVNSARGDIGPGWQVRTSHETPPGRLVIRPRDPDNAIFIHVFARSPSCMLVNGWITAHEARKVGIVEGFNGYDPACFVDVSALHPIVDLVSF